MNNNQIPALQGHCPVGYFAVGEALEGKAEFSSEHNGKLYRFVSQEAKQMFDNNPHNYLPEFGGLCAFGMSIDKEFEVDPKNFKIIDGKLYLFLKNEETNALELWNRDEEKCLANANKHWAARTAS